MEDTCRLYVFGTGNATVTRCYNTCFAIRRGDEYFMTDAGGGNGILSILEQMEVPIPSIRHLFVTHEHTDHILGVVWMIRMAATAIKKGIFPDGLSIYCHDGLADTIRTLCRLTIQEKYYSLIGGPIRIIPVKDGETRSILGIETTFFDIHSTKARQFGFAAVLPDGKRVCFPGDEPLPPSCESFAAGSDWLFHEAFCLHRDREKYRPYEKHHSTVKDACELAERLGVSRLLLWHTEDDHTLPERRRLYLEEGRACFHGTICVPEDREILTL